MNESYRGVEVVGQAGEDIPGCLSVGITRAAVVNFSPPFPRNVAALWVGYSTLYTG